MSQRPLISGNRRSRARGPRRIRSVETFQSPIRRLNRRNGPIEKLRLGFLGNADAAATIKKTRKVYMSFARNSEWDNQIIKALAVAIETDNFSDAWCQAAAECRCDELLNDAQKI